MDLFVAVKSKKNFKYEKEQKFYRINSIITLLLVLQIWNNTL